MPWASAEIGLDPKRFAPDALIALCELPCPGNVRQLENTCRRLAVLASGRQIQAGDLALELRSAVAPIRPAWSVALAEFDHELLDAALLAHNGHRQNVAKTLASGRNRLTRKLGSSRRRTQP